jgi:dienelactone hydrolase
MRNLHLTELAEHWSAGSPKRQHCEQQSDELRLQNPNQERAVRIPVDRITLEGDLVVPDAGRGLVLFAHGSGSSRHSPRNRYVAQVLQQAGLATLLMDLLTIDEEALDAQTAELRFDIELLACRLVGATNWISSQPQMAQLPIGYFGASTGAAAALVAAAELPDLVAAVVSRGGRPDLAGKALRRVVAPTLLIVGGEDLRVLELNWIALAELRGPKKLEIIPGATHLFEGKGALESVAQFAKNWLLLYLFRANQRARTALRQATVLKK